MKKKLFIMALVAVLFGSLSSCSSSVEKSMEKSYPILYVVNSSDYTIQFYCDNQKVATTSAHNNSGAITLSSVSINLPVFVEVYYYDNKGNYVNRTEGDDYQFHWNKSYKLTVHNKGMSLQQL